MSVTPAQVFFPFAPGFESISEPAMEEVEEALDMAKENLDHMQARGAWAASSL